MPDVYSVPTIRKNPVRCDGWHSGRGMSATTSVRTMEGSEQVLVELLDGSHVKQRLADVRVRRQELRVSELPLDLVR